MATKLDHFKWKLYKKKRSVLCDFGILFGLIKPYDEQLIEKLRDVYYGGIPASVCLLSERGVSHHCYDRALLLAHAFKDEKFRMVDADVDGIVLNPKNIDYYENVLHYGNHCFIEKEDEKGMVWVYDTTNMLIYEKNLYYAIQRPKITMINEKEAVLNYCEFVDVENANLENDKYAATLLLPLIEKQIEGQKIYKEELVREIQLYKEKINYESLCSELPSFKERQYSKKTTS